MTSENNLEQFVLLAKTAKGAAAVGLINQVLEAPGIFVFGELLDMPNIQELSSGPNEAHYNLLNLFAYGTYKDYKENKAKLPELTTIQLTKLRHLTVVSLATKTKCIPYSVLLRELDIQNVRAIEDIIIEVICADVIHGKLDQKNQQLEIDYAIGRDIKPESIPVVISVLQDWCDSCETVLKGIEDQVSKANQCKDNNNKIKAQIEQEVINIKKTLKTSHQQDLDDQMITDSQASTSQDKPSKKQSKTKGLRGSGATKSWK
ncbi:hypothetical protein LOTGIDRAFT_231121 [Lottia gigantea]|uniref:PCI domain-containing protein n=1 Tax=Lottia gigantea TaxID=225164 RepID=V4CCB9_LOTGI|nr:hypothetical protein LOTGIDRAFT_231121 [Lottia gigantea]ESO99539.1 hypothetical protein LOTGIDRAFT_231121 [Lottia gigantea]